MHVLIPQVECAVRELMVALGGGVMTYDPNVGGFKAATLGSLLASDLFAERIPTDIVFHLCALYSEPKGLNLRNEVAHGLAPLAMLSMNTANWIVHTLLVFALAFNRKANDEQEVAR